MVSGFPDWQLRAFTSAKNFEQQKISATAVESTNSFTLQIKSCFIYNDGVNPVHLNFDATATTNHVKIVSKAWLFIDLEMTDIHAICAAGETATVYAVGFY